MAKIIRESIAFISIIFVQITAAEYLGKFLGKLSELHHGVSGEVYAVDGKTLHIKDFTYDGQGPSAYFYASTYKTADSKGFRLRDENNNGDVIKRYRKQGVTLTLPEGKTLNNIKIFYVWCEEFDVNFGDVKIPRNFDYPRPQKIDALKGVHGISSDNVVIVDAQTLLVPNLYYDGEAPDAKFWVGKGPKPSPQGIRVPDENGKETPLRRYAGKTVVLTLPGDLTIFDLGHFGIWCEEFTVDFGHIQVPQSLNIPPSLKMLGISPQSKLNCEVLKDDPGLEVRWAIAGESIVLQLVGKLENREYMSFGLSGDDSKSIMIGGDVVVAWIDKDTLKGYVQDYYLADKSQCSGPSGSCPDTKLKENTDNIRLLNAALVNGYSIVTYQRPLKASDQFDLPIYTNRSQAIIWAVGPLNQRDEVSFHTSYLKSDNLLEFGRPAKWNCPVPENDKQPARVQHRQESIDKNTRVEAPTIPSRRGGESRRGSNRPRRPPVEEKVDEPVVDTTSNSRRQPSSASRRQTFTITTNSPAEQPQKVEKPKPWEIPPIQCDEPDDGVFYAQMGPTGGKYGYKAITGHVGWGISWYINGLLIPVINVVRGTTYTFVTEGGDDPEIPAKYHPFYITDDPVGGYHYKTLDERKNVTIFAGVRYDGDKVIPVGTGRLCNWLETSDREADDFESFGAYQRTLQLKCDIGDPGVFQWTPDRNTPDTVYYQCFTHRYLGWKINVLDTCDDTTRAAASEVRSINLEAPEEILKKFAAKMNAEESRVNPNYLLFNDMKADNTQPTVSENSSKKLAMTSNFIGQQIITDKIPKNSCNKSSIDDNTKSTKIINSRKTRSILTNSKNSIQPDESLSILRIPIVTKVEISQQQASTEKEPTSIAILQNRNNQFDKNQSSIHAEIDSEGQIGIIEMDDEIKITKKSLAKKSYVKIQHKPTGAIAHLLNIEIEPEMSAADRIDSYYLPPAGRHSTNPHPKLPNIQPKQPSNIDFDLPKLAQNSYQSDIDSESASIRPSSQPEVVVTYDGRRVSGASLTARPLEHSTGHLAARSSKASELIRIHPQSVPFRGDLPPLNPDVFFDTKSSRKMVKSTAGVLNRDLDTPFLSSTAAGSTKLSRVRA